MPGPEQLIRAAVTLPLTVTRRIAGLAWSLVPGSDTAEAPTEPVEEEAIFTPDDDFFEDDHVESEVELVAESAEPWEGYRRMKVAEITAQIAGQPAEVLAAVGLYEATHRKRRGVLEAVRTATRG